MSFASSAMFAKRILFPKTSRLSLARKSLSGAILCIGISIVPLVVILTVSNGMIEGITNRMISLSSSHIEAVSVFRPKEDELEKASALCESEDQVTFSYPCVSASALSVFGKKRCGVLVRSIPQELFLPQKTFGKLFKCEAGSIEGFYSDQSKKSVLIGKGIAERLDAGPGQKIRVVTLKKKSLGNFVPVLSTFTVAAVVSSGYRELDGLWLFVPFDQGKKILSGSEARYSVMVETENPFSAQLNGIQKSLQQKLGGDFRVYRWNQLNRAQYENFSSTKILLIFIQLLIVLVSCVNISSALVMLVLERRREIAILKSLGAPGKEISFSFLLLGLAAGAAGLLLGLPVGLFFGVNINSIITFMEKVINFFARGLYFLRNNGIIGFAEVHLLDENYYLQEIPVSIPFGELFLIGSSTLFLSVLVSVFPARKAGREKPLDTLRDSR